jgi:hypothetical protein
VQANMEPLILAAWAGGLDADSLRPK